MNENYIYQQSPNYPIGRLKSHELNDLTDPLTSGVVYDLNDYDDLAVGCYLLNVYARIIATEDASFNSIRLDFAVTNVEINPTSSFSFPKDVTDGQPMKVSFEEIIIVENPENAMNVGLVATFTTGSYDITEFTCNLVKVA